MIKDGCLLIVLGVEVLQVTSLHAVTVREDDLSLVSPDTVMGIPATTSPASMDNTYF